ncbi:MAG: TIGR03617 family F420-dependent LLM class oxidoreductase [Chloroflexi bacterium]|nr:TIGR03617 family F420-dependent LLM class oxidoreductase [Chloroflexota bacterium]
MKFDVNILTPNLLDAPDLIRAAEDVGFDCLWTSETQHDPFLPLALAAEHTTRIHLGTAIAVAFARSPTVIAQTAWDLQSASRGRFILGLGTQVKAHIERRFGMTWDAPAPRLREMILALRALWRAWQGDGAINFRGEFYKITLMTPFFNPGPIEHPDIPIFIAGVNEHLCRVAGEVCQGFHVHPFHTVEYIRQIVLPNIAAGAALANRTRADLELSSTLFVATDDAEREAVRAQIAFYASTPSYKAILDVHGWGEINKQLGRLAARQRWDEMPALVSDELLNAVAIVAPLEEIPARIHARYAGVLDRVALYLPFLIDEADKWRVWVRAFRTDRGLTSA